MPELKRNFLKGKMNKDLDERLVPNGEYRDALNIEISTSEDSNVGSAQTLKGNSALSFSTAMNLSANAISVGHYVDEESGLIYNFIHKASDFGSNGLGVRSDAIVVVNPKNNTFEYLFVDVYDVRYKPTAFNGSVISGIIQQSVTSTSGHSWDGAKGIRAGMRVQAINTSGVDLWGAQNDVRVTGVSAAASTVSVTDVVGVATPYSSADITANTYIKFTSDRILNFEAGTLEQENNVSGSTGFKYTPKNNIITGINIVDDFLLFTDGRTEPKKINTERFNGTAASFTTHSKLTIKNNLSLVTTRSYAEESHVTVARINPITPIVVETNYVDSEGAVNSTVKGNTTGADQPYNDAFTLNDGTDVFEGGAFFYIETVAETDYQVNTELKLVGQSSASVAFAYVETILANNKYKLKLISSPESYTPSAAAEVWMASIHNKEALYKTSFVNFTYRFKYTDGEVSCLAPYSLPAFIPGGYSYSPKDGFNLGMENQMASVKLKGFTPWSRPKDIVGVDIMVKSSNSQNLYIIRSLDIDDEEFNQSFTINSVPSAYSRGQIKITSEALGRTLESDQISRVFDDVPRSALAQEFTAGRLMYGNYIKDYNLTSSGQSISADVELQSVIDNVNFATNYDSTNVFQASMPTSTAYSPTFATENVPIPCSVEFDPGNNYSSTSYVYDVPEDGIYNFTGSLKVSGQGNLSGEEGVAAQFKLQLWKCNIDGTILATQITENVTASVGGGANEYETISIQAEVSLLNTEYVCLVVTEHSAHADQQSFKLGFFACISAPDTTFSLTSLSGLPSVKSDRSYKIGVVYADKYGRQSTVIVDEKSTLAIAKNLCANKNIIQAKILNNAPDWAETYRFFIKETASKYYNLVLEAAFDNNDEETAWLVFNSADVNKVKVGDFLIQKKKHNSVEAVMNDKVKWKILDIQGGLDVTINPLTGDETTVPSIGGIDVNIPDALISSTSDLIGKFFVKINYDSNFQTYIGNDFSTLGVVGNNNGAAFETEIKESFDLDLFYEVGQAYPIKLTKELAPEYIQIGSKIEFHSSNASDLFGDDIGALAEADIVSSLASSGRVKNIDGAISFPSGIVYDGNTTDRQLCVITVNGFLGEAYAVGAQSEIVLRFVKDDGSYVCGRMVAAADSVIKIIPYTHVTSNQPSLKIPIGLPFFNCYAFGNGVESDTIRDDFNAETIFPYVATGKQSGFKASFPSDSYEELNEKNEIIYSSIYNEGAGVNKINQFIAAESIVKRINPENGSIQKLYSRDTDLVIFCEKKVLRGPINKNIIFNADGTSQLATSKKVIGDVFPYASGDHGISTNPESFAVDEFRSYFVDKARGAVIRLSTDGMTVISDYGMKDWFSDKLANAQAIVGSFDGDKGEYNITIHEITNPLDKKNVYTISFSEDVKGWTSFKSYIKEQGFSLDNKYYTIKAGKIYKHDVDTVNRNNFYGADYNSTIKLLFNENSGSVKEFTTINYEGTQSRVIEFTNESGYDDGEYYNVSAKTGWYANSVTTDLQEGSVPEFVEKEGKWFNYIKGVQTTFTSDGTAYNLDTREASVQGLGVLASDATIVSGTVVDEGSNLLFSNVSGLETVNWYTSGLSFYGLYELDGTQTNTFIIYPQPGYIIQASDFYNDTTSIYYSAVSFADNGIAGQASNSVTVTVTFINQVLGNANSLTLGFDILSDEINVLTYSYYTQFSFDSSSYANQTYGFSSSLSTFNSSVVTGAVLPDTYFLTAELSPSTIQEIVTINVYADEGYYFSYPPSLNLVDSGASVTQQITYNDEGNAIGYAFTIFDQTAFDMLSSGSDQIILNGGNSQVISSTFQASSYYVDNTQQLNYFIPITNNGGLPQVTESESWISIEAITIDGIFININANSGSDRNGTITMYDSYDIGQSDAETLTITQGTANIIEWQYGNQSVNHTASSIQLLLATNGSAPVAGDFSISYGAGSGWLTISNIQHQGGEFYTIEVALTANSSAANRDATITLTHSGGSPTDDITITQSFAYAPSVHTVDIYENTDCDAFETLGTGYKKSVAYSGGEFTIYAKSSSTLNPIVSEIPNGDSWYSWTSSYNQVPSVVAALAQAPDEESVEIQISAPLPPVSLTCGGTGTPYQVTVDKNYSNQRRIINYNFYYQDSDGVVNNSGTADAFLRVFQEGNHASWFYNVSADNSAPTSMTLSEVYPGEEPNLCDVIDVDSDGESVTILFKSEAHETTPPKFKWFEINALPAGSTYDWNALWGSATTINVSAETNLPSYVSGVSRNYNSAAGLGSITLTFDAHNTGTDASRTIRLGITHPDITSTKPDHEVQITQENSTL